MNHKLQEVYEKFLVFSPGPASEVRVFFAPGRVNLIGEHTDYNGGYVLPAALELGTWVFVRLRNKPVFRFASTAFEQVVTAQANHMVFRTEDLFANYAKGIVAQFQQRSIAVPGLDILYHGNLPSGAGLSSSASVEVATAAAINELTGAGLSKEELALLSQKAENEFVGVNCGIMDQFAVAMGKQNEAVLLDCDTLNYELVPVSIQNAVLVIANSNKRRELTESKYNERRQECEAALHQLRRVRPGLRYLAEINGDEWLDFEPYIDDPVLQRRARHVVLENQRAKDAFGVLSSGELQRFGEMMNQSHVSLRDDYEVTGFELDTLAERAWEAPGCLGSRMTGAGFGGCTISLVRQESVEDFIRVTGAGYQKAMGYQASFYVTSVGEGVREVTEHTKGIRPGT